MAYTPGVWLCLQTVITLLHICYTAAKISIHFTAQDVMYSIHFTAVTQIIKHNM